MIIGREAKISVLAIFILLATVSTAYAHPPSDIKITFNAKTKMLRAVIVHNTSNRVNHYIKKVNIGLNGKDIIGCNFSIQENNEVQTIGFFIPDVKDGDVLSVEGYCSISGKLKKEITLKQK